MSFDWVERERPHAVCIPYPSQGHLTPLLQLAKLLNARGFHITYVNTEFNHNRLLRSRGPDSLKGLDDFRFEAIPDGLPPSDRDATQDVPALSESTTKNCTVPFLHLITRLNASPNIPPVTCIVSDGVMTFTLDAAEELGIPALLFWTPSACGFLGYLHYQFLLDRGMVPLKDEKNLIDGTLDEPIDWIPGMNGIRLRDFPSFVRTTDRNDIMFNFFIREAGRASKALAIVMNTFDDFECDALHAIRSMIPNLYTIGPLSIPCSKLPESPLTSLGSNLWKEDSGCLEWLDKKELRSVVFVNFGSVTVMTAKHLEEFAWGLANSNRNFLWIIRPDVVMGESAKLPPQFVSSTKERGLLVSWCPQEKVLSHPSVGVFLTHCGWNSILESICGGVPIICWPFFGEQPTNCRYACREWGIGMEIDKNVKREEVEVLVREMMEGERGREMRKKAIEWKLLAHKATNPGGSSYVNMEKLVNNVLCPTI